MKTVWSTPRSPQQSNFLMSNCPRFPSARGTTQPSATQDSEIDDDAEHAAVLADKRTLSGIPLPVADTATGGGLFHARPFDAMPTHTKTPTRNCARKTRDACCPTSSCSTPTPSWSRARKAALGIHSPRTGQFPRKTQPHAKWKPSWTRRSTRRRPLGRLALGASTSCPHQPALAPHQGPLPRHGRRQSAAQRTG